MWLRPDLGLHSGLDLWLLSISDIMSCRCFPFHSVWYKPKLRQVDWLGQNFKKFKTQEISECLSGYCQRVLFSFEHTLRVKTEISVTKPGKPTDIHLQLCLSSLCWNSTCDHGRLTGRQAYSTWLFVGLLMVMCVALCVCLCVCVAYRKRGPHILKNSESSITCQRQ